MLAANYHAQGAEDATHPRHTWAEEVTQGTVHRLAGTPTATRSSRASVAQFVVRPAAGQLCATFVEQGVIASLVHAQEAMRFANHAPLTAGQAGAPLPTSAVGVEKRASNANSGRHLELRPGAGCGARTYASIFALHAASYESTLTLAERICDTWCPALGGFVKIAGSTVHWKSTGTTCVTCPNCATVYCNTLGALTRFEACAAG